MNSSNYNLLIEKLDAFTRRYYSNQLIRGLIYSIAVVLIFFLAITLLENAVWFNTGVRTLLFYAFILLSGFIFIRLIVIPVTKIYRLGKTISHQQASEIIGKHFPNVSDKLLNTLQLHEQAGQSAEHIDLVNASIDQKIADLKPVPFSSAIDLSKNRKYIPYALVPLLALVVILFTSPSLIKDSALRLVNHSTAFEKPAPFHFVVLNKELKTIQQEDFDLNIKMEGNEIPDNIYVQVGSNQFRLDKENRIKFNYTFKNVQHTTSFKLFADGFYSKEYELNAVPNPIVLNFSAALSYPSYLNKPNEVLNNTGDMIIPAGTKVKWNFLTQNTVLLRMAFQDTVVSVNNSEPDHFSLQKTFLKNNSYSVVTANNQLRGKDSMIYTVSVIPDLYPSIQVDQQSDSVSTQRTYFKGLIKDDYGFSRLSFCYKFLKSNDSIPKNKDLVADNISINRNANQDQFFYYWDATVLNISPGDEIEYYFEVWDNDGVSGPKSSRSQAQIFKAPTLRELAENADKSNDKVKEDLTESMKQAAKLQKQIADAAKKMLEKKNLEYDDKKKIEDLLKQGKELEEKVKNLQQEQRQNVQKENEYKKANENIADKQKQIQDLFDKLMSDEMKQLMQQLQDMMAQIDKQKAQEMLDKMKLSSKDLEKQLDRTLELFKQLEVEKKVKDAIDNLEKLAKDQEKLADQSNDKNADNKDLEQKQKELSQKFEDIKKDINDADKKNKELEFPQDMANTEQEQKDIDQQQQESEQQLGENKKSKASKSQKSASEKMEQMAMKMKQQQQENEQQQSEEDMNALRYLLENLIRLSLDQEALMGELKDIDVNNPQYVKKGQQQQKLKDDSQGIEDSLFALSKRVPQIQTMVNTEIAKINDNMDKSIKHLQDRFVPQARSEQQYAMTSVNNLALLLSEALNQMQQQMQSQKPSSGQCKKPGKGKPNPSAQKLKQMQQQLGDQLKQMKGKMEQQSKERGKGQKGMSEELARMAAEQEAIRQEMEKFNQQENKDGKNSLGNLGDAANKMEENEKDIVNKKITEETLKRQQEILTRLLEAENAERQREQEERRESNEAKNQQQRNPPQFEEYKKLKTKEVEMLKTIPPNLNAFYRNLVNYYFQSLEN